MDPVIKMAVLIAAGAIFSSGNVSTPENALEIAIKLWGELNVQYPTPAAPAEAVTSAA